MAAPKRKPKIENCRRHGPFVAFCSIHEPCADRRGRLLTKPKRGCPCGLCRKVHPRKFYAGMIISSGRLWNVRATTKKPTRKKRPV